MKYHKYDQETLLYTETVEADEQPANSVDGNLPDQCENYTLAFIENTWVSVLRPELEIVDNKIQKRNLEQETKTLEAQEINYEGQSQLEVTDVTDAAGAAAQQNQSEDQDGTST